MTYRDGNGRKRIEVLFATVLLELRNQRTKKDLAAAVKPSILAHFSSGLCRVSVLSPRRRYYSMLRDLR